MVEDGGGLVGYYKRKEEFADVVDWVDTGIDQYYRQQKWVSGFGGLERWNGTVEWTGLEWWNGMEWNGGMIEYAHDSPRGPQRPNFMYEISKSPDFRNGFPDFWYIS